MGESYETMASSTYEWLHHHYYQQQTMELAGPNYEGFSDNISVSTGFSDNTFLDPVAMDVSGASVASGDTIKMVAHGPENSCAPSNNLRPKAGVGKPAARRRSRASRRTPTILLDASAKDFGALVQLYTGCNTATSSSIKFQNDAINLRFGPSNEQKYFAAATFGGNFGGRCDDRVHSQEQDQRCQPELTQAYQGEQSSFTFVDYPSNSGPTLVPLNHFRWV